MTVANVNVTKVLLKRGNTAQNNNYTGVNGELTIDTQAATLRIHDGTTTGGTVINAGGVAGAYSNTNTAAYLELQSITSANIGAFQTYANANAASQTTEIDSLRANITAANSAITSLTSNAAVQAALLDSLTGNAATQGQVLDTLTSNAAVQADTLTTLLSNAVAQQTSLIDLVANAVVQAQQIANVTGTYSNTNVAAYLGAFDGNILPAANITYSLGDSTHQWRDLWVSNNTIYIGNTPIKVDGGTLLVDGAPVSLGFDQDLNTTDNVAFANIVTTGGQITVPTDTSFALRLNHSTFGEASVIVDSQGYMSITGGYTGTFFTQTLSDGEQIGSFGYGGNISDIYGKNGLTISTVGEGGPQWTFDTNGDLSVPNYINFEGNTYIGDEPGGGNPMFRIVTPLGYGATIETDSDLSGNSWTWSFGVDGTLGSPGDITAVNFIGDGSQLTGLPDGTAITNGTSTIDIPVAGGNIYVGVDNVGSTEFTINGINTLNLVSLGNVSATKFTYANGVNILDGISGNVTGNISVGDGRINFVASSSGDGNGFSTIEIRPDDVYTSNENYLIIDPTTPNHIHIRAGGVQDNSNAELYLGGENSYFMVDNGVNPDVYISANSQVWAFDGAGALSFPNSQLIATANQNFLFQADDDDTLTLRTHTGGIIGGTDFDWVFDNTGKLTLPGSVASLQYSSGNLFIDADANIVIGNSGGSSYWAFNANTQAITFPDATVQPTAFFGYSVPTTFNDNVNIGGNVLVSGTITGQFTAPGGNTQIIYNNNDLADASAAFTFNPVTETVAVANTVQTSNLTATGNVTVGNIASTNGFFWANGTAYSSTLTFGNTIAIGYNTGTVSQGGGAVAVGSTAGNVSQGTGAVAIGEAAGRLSQGAEGIAVGKTAGEQSQGAYSIAIGSATAYYQQGTGAVAIGTSAGALQQGNSAIAIGTGAGNALQGDNSIILNATGTTLDQTTANTFTVAPIRNISTTDGVLQYNVSTKEVSYSSTLASSLSFAGNITQQSAYYETYANVSNSGGNLTCNFVDGATFYVTLNANVTVNFTNVVATAGQATGATIIVDQGATPYQISNVQINGGAVQTVKWAGGTTNTGTASNTDIMSFSLIGLDGGAWRVLGQISNYG